MGRKGPGVCVYCGVEGARSQDHVPPRNLYATPKPPKGAPWVRACEKCNAGFSLDDEYFRDVILKHHVVSDLPAAQRQVDKMLSAIGKPEKRAYAVATLESFRAVDVIGKDGQYLGKQPALRVNNHRFGRVAERIACGLSLWEGHSPGEPDAVVAVHWTPQDIEAAGPTITEFFTSGDVRTIQPGVFWYAIKHAVDHPKSFMALLVFFDVFPVVVVVRRRDQLE